ncbi:MULTISPECIES: response regulator transcription factor [unclassified Microbulbifer]|uniref:Response regulator transcription factor n=1 Tax=Microbulbifer spongiae TaxID=2944933 RepID=A0ABY9EIG4_9GAMM|nr:MULTISPECIES: response regulator transcription factor [unclassified Microbulbifer]MDP5209956.1 response regulator transcription factor [Microbulbifer sp. 2205BS26-8]WKD50826.1 response regulator transcription factor [Microbulbifer sp. MI-G]
MRALLVEDEALLRQQLAQSLRDAGYTVDEAPDGEEALYLGREYPYDIAVMDLGLPRMDGIQVIQSLRSEERHFPILILTARGHWQERVAGLEAGGDDYLVKPFHTEELLARLNALVRRSAGFSSPTIKAGPISLDTSSQRVVANGVELELTSFEYKVLEYLMMHPDEVVSKTTLTEHIYEQDCDRDSNVIEVFIGRLRKKITATTQCNPIETLRGRGYRFVIPR